jgi:hypothetical protein
VRRSRDDRGENPRFAGCLLRGVVESPANLQLGKSAATVGEAKVAGKR